MIPQCIVFSCGRAGSTSIYHYLNDTAKLKLPRNKEPHFWLGEIAGWRAIPKVLEGIAINNRTAYEALYRDSRLSIDASVAYYHHTDIVLANLATAQISPRAIMLVREPISWARSLHAENLFQGLETENDLVKCLSENREDPSIWWQLRYSSVRYVEVFERLSDALGEVLLIDHSQLEIAPRTVLERACHFLSIEAKKVPPTTRYHERIDRLAAMQLGPYYRLWKYLPKAIRQRALSLMQHPTRDFIPHYEDAIIAPYLAESIESYERLRRCYREDFAA